MEPVDLDPGDYDGTYKLVGGQVSLDLVNTVSWPRDDNPHDWLDRPQNLVRWADAVGLRGGGLGGDGSLDQVHSIRADITSVLVPLAHGEVVPEDSLDTLSQLMAEAGRRRRIALDTYRWVWPEPATYGEMLDPVVWNAGVVVTEVDHERLGYCPSCDWVFHDTTRNRSRRWCDMADCGSRDKALRYYRRTVQAQRRTRDR